MYICGHMWIFIKSSFPKHHLQTLHLHCKFNFWIGAQRFGKELFMYICICKYTYLHLHVYMSCIPRERGMMGDAVISAPHSLSCCSNYLALPTYALGPPLQGARHTSGGRAISCNSLDPSAQWIDTAWWMHLQFGLFSVPTSGPQLVHQRCGMYCCPVCGKVHLKDPFLLIGNRSLCGNSGFPLKKYVTMTICLTSNSQ